jgi:cysteine desulfurase
MSVYLDCNATTPLAPQVREAMLRYFDVEYGNAGSRTHEYGLRANQAVQRAREQVAAVVAADPQEVIFTSGATESNNLAILGLAAHGQATNRRHIITSAIEHKGVLEPCDELRKRGFEVSVIGARADGSIVVDQLQSVLRPDTLLVSIMHVNNETGVIQPLQEVCRCLAHHQAYFHVDAAQGFGKELQLLTSPRIDMISVSGHKIYGPKGIGALITRRRGSDRAPLAPLMFGGGQERGLRPGTHAVPLIVGLGVAAELSISEHNLRSATNQDHKARVLAALSALGMEINGNIDRSLPSTLNFSLPGLDSEAVMLALKDFVAVSNGSACTSQSYRPSHVLSAMGFSDDRVAGAVRLSWCHMSEDIDWAAIVSAIRRLL